MGSACGHALSSQFRVETLWFGSTRKTVLDVTAIWKPPDSSCALVALTMVGVPPGRVKPSKRLPGELTGSIRVGPIEYEVALAGAPLVTSSRRRVEPQVAMYVRARTLPAAFGAVVPSSMMCRPNCSICPGTACDRFAYGVQSAGMRRGRTDERRAAAS